MKSSLVYNLFLGNTTISCCYVNLVALISKNICCENKINMSYLFSFDFVPREKYMVPKSSLLASTLVLIEITVC